MNLRVLTTGPMRTAGILLVAASLAIPAWAVEPNYCHDEASWAEWHELLAGNPADDGIYGLYALRRGLCDMVEAGTIEQARATRIFEGAREELVGKRMERNRLKKPEM